MKINIMMRTILLSVIALAATMSCIAQGRIQGNGQTVERQRSVGTYKALSVRNGMDVEISGDLTEGIIVVADENLQEYVETKVEDGTLKIAMKQGYGYRLNGKSPKVIVPNTGQLTAISVSGGSDVYTKNTTLQGDALSIACSGGSDFKGDINVKRLDVACSGGSDFNASVEAEQCDLAISGGSDGDLSGYANVCSVAVSGGSDFKAHRFVTKDCDLSVSGGSDVDIHCTERLSAKVGGGSDVIYTGDCTVTMSVDKSSNLKKK